MERKFYIVEIKGNPLFKRDTIAKQLKYGACLKNLLKNYCTRNANIYTKAFIYSEDSDLLNRDRRFKTRGPKEGFKV